LSEVFVLERDKISGIHSIYDAWGGFLDKDFYRRGIRPYEYIFCYQGRVFNSRNWIEFLPEIKGYIEDLMKYNHFFLPRF